MITVESTDAGLRVMIPKGEVPPETVSTWLDWLRLEAIVARSRLSEQEADRLAEGVKADWWASHKDRFTKPVEG
jgi:hypothetical protein